jgi:hypothetical protein
MPGGPEQKTCLAVVPAKAGTHDSTVRTNGQMETAFACMTVSGPASGKSDPVRHRELVNFSTP